VRNFFHYVTWFLVLLQQKLWFKPIFPTILRWKFVSKYYICMYDGDVRRHSWQIGLLCYCSPDIWLVLVVTDVWLPPPIERVAPRTWSIGIECMSSSASWRALCNWISIQQGVSYTSKKRSKQRFTVYRFCKILIGLNY